MPTPPHYIAMLELAPARDSDPLRNPAPWSWEAWEDLTGCDHAPWAPEATPTSTGLKEHELEAVKAFVKRYFNMAEPADTTVVQSEKKKSGKKGTKKKDRISYAMDPDDNDVLGRNTLRQWIADRWGGEWDLNKVIDEVFESRGRDMYSVATKTGDSLLTLEQSGVGIAFNDIAQRVFGCDPFTSDQFLDPLVSRWLTHISAITWNRWRKLFSRRRGSVTLLQKKVDAAYEAISGETCQTGEIRKYVQNLKGLVEKLGFFKDGARRAKLDEYEAQLRVMEQVVLKGDDAPETKKLPAALRRALAHLPTEKDVNNILLDIAEALRTFEEEFLVTPIPNVRADLGPWSEGTEAYADVDESAVNDLLGIKDSYIPGLSDSEDPDGLLDLWTVAGRKAMQGKKAARLRLRWHQLVGILRIMERAFEGKPLLLMDEVGIGKTAQAIGTIAIWEWYRTFYASKGFFPGKFKGLKFPGTSDGNLPERSHIVVCPVSLVEQWEVELHRWLRFGAFSVLPYVGACTDTNRVAFWETFSSKQKTGVGRRIILASHSAVKADAGVYFLDPQKKGDRPTAAKSIDKGLSEHTLFSKTREYGLLLVDEAHALRTQNKFYVGSTELRHRASMTVGMTATPVMTTPRDLCNIGRFLGLPPFEDDPKKWDEHRKALDRAVRHARQRRRQNGGDLKLARALVKGKKTRKADDTEYNRAVADWINDIREAFDGAVIRRTINSLDWRRLPISGLEPYHEHVMQLELTEEELDVQDKLAEAVVQGGGASKGGKNLSAFYLGIRQALLHVALSGLPEHEWEKGDTYSSRASTKIEALLEIVMHHLEKQGAPPLCVNPDTDTHNELIPNPEYDPPSDSDTTSTADRPDRIVVYLAFPKNNWIVEKAFEEVGIKYTEINGSMTPAARWRALHKFKTDPDTRVLILSGVGLVGLNISNANILIVGDTLWSAQDDSQLGGRIWRQPQDKVVHIYRLIARNTSDVFLNNISFDKARMHQAFINSSVQLRRAFDQSDNEITDDEDSDDDADAQATKVKTKKSKDTGKTKSKDTGKTKSKDTGKTKSKDTSKTKSTVTKMSAPSTSVSPAIPVTATLSQQGSSCNGSESERDESELKRDEPKLKHDEPESENKESESENGEPENHESEYEHEEHEPEPESRESEPEPDTYPFISKAASQRFSNFPSEESMDVDNPPIRRSRHGTTKKANTVNLDESSEGSDIGNAPALKKHKKDLESTRTPTTSGDGSLKTTWAAGRKRSKGGAVSAAANSSKTKRVSSLAETQATSSGAADSVTPDARHNLSPTEWPEWVQQRRAGERAPAGGLQTLPASLGSAAKKKRTLGSAAKKGMLSSAAKKRTLGSAAKKGMLSSAAKKRTTG